ncbi:MAG: 3-deoxy-manno-octulosonate cytidylyltransferase [Aurantimonas sp.]|jgi:3-deoxy-manno-octulosonate cytidylyltransferase (CMP-KDO synthetase)|nr:3-deoxy-manno-octulosonate cytidylyltransferase [Aurantimonas sp.]HBT01283.1 3-deoxy-manno-octulosonate cytidylyltransferase [Citreicella sp.]|tara:strand:+ start:2545 stop:3339 length:795 start_codon:yes stop_codon:yes gene_type:complete
MPEPIILIPARYASSRYPGKPLVTLKGADGEKTLIQRSWEVACSVLPKEQVYVCTDDDRIIAAAEGFGAQTIMTSEDCRNGTERCAEAVRNLGIDADIVVNFQGDAPLTPPWFVEDLIAAMRNSPEVSAATPVLRCDAETLRSFKSDRKAGRVGGTTAVFDTAGNALYFSKEIIPFCDSLAKDAPIPVFHHVGVYAFRAKALAAYPELPLGTLEQLEGLEQLRFLENGLMVKCVEVNARGRIFWELNNPTDVALIEAELQKETA